MTCACKLPCSSVSPQVSCDHASAQHTALAHTVLCALQILSRFLRPSGACTTNDGSIIEFHACDPSFCVNVTSQTQQEKGGRQQLVPQPRFGQMLSPKARLIVLASSILVITMASIGASGGMSLKRARLSTTMSMQHRNGVADTCSRLSVKRSHTVVDNTVFVVYWRVSRRGYWLLIVSAAFWLGTMVAMKLLLPLDYVPAKWSIPHW